MAGDTGIVCCVDGQPIYRKTFFVVDTTAQDVLIAHDNGSAIKEANGLDATKSNAVSAEALGFDDTDEEDTLVNEVVTDEVTEDEVDEVNETFEL